MIAERDYSEGQAEKLYRDLRRHLYPAYADWHRYLTRLENERIEAAGLTGPYR